MYCKTLLKLKFSLNSPLTPTKFPSLFYYTPRFNEVDRGVYWYHLVRLSVCGQNRVRSVSSTILIGSISYLHILSSNFRRCVACNAHFKIKKSVSSERRRSSCSSYYDYTFPWTYFIQPAQSFYTPVWKTGRIMPWRCPSVRPSVRPCFPDFSSTCFEISIWNLVYTFSRWHDMSSLSCITIGSLWPSLQPKVGQTYFLQSRPHKSR